MPTSLKETRLYDGWTVYELKTRVKDLGMNGYCDKSRAELIHMLGDPRRAGR